MTQRGFTLAETLITLVIIGVVSALTIPTLINSTQDRELKTAFKKSYSTISQALKMVEIENSGSPYKCYIQDWWIENRDECSEFWPVFKKQFRLIREYSGTPDGVNLPNYTGVEFIEAQGGHNANSSCSAGKSGQTKEAWTLSDGSMIISQGDTFSYPIIILDTNGVKKPNKWGYDLFILNISKNNNVPSVVINDELCGAQEKGGYTVKDILTSQ